MILFYSDYCPHCKMLINTIKRHDSRKVVKLVCIEILQAAGKPIPPQIHSVPTLILAPSKEMLVGKNVFDYLLLPGKGKLLVQSEPTPPSANAAARATPAQSGGDPVAYSLDGAASGFSESFMMIEDNGHQMPNGGLDDRSYMWTTIESQAPAPAVPAHMLQEDTRVKNELPSLDAFKARRELELTQSDISTPQVIQPSFTR